MLWFTLCTSSSSLSASPFPPILGLCFYQFSPLDLLSSLRTGTVLFNFVFFPSPDPNPFFKDSSIDSPGHAARTHALGGRIAREREKDRKQPRSRECKQQRGHVASLENPPIKDPHSPSLQYCLPCYRFCWTSKSVMESASRSRRLPVPA